jgi:hypothetical protein
MNRKVLLSILISLSLFYLAQASPALAHPADVYTHAIHVTLAEDSLSIQWEIKPGPMLVSFIWYQADANQDEFVSPQKAEAWGMVRASLFSVTVKGAPLPLQLDEVKFPDSLNSFQARNEFITIHLFATWPKNQKRFFSTGDHERNGGGEIAKLVLSPAKRWFEIPDASTKKYPAAGAGLSFECAGRSG